MNDPSRPPTPPGEKPTEHVARDTSPLAVGHVLQEYVIEGLIGEGKSSTVYRAHDTRLGRVVALKEYLPSSLVSRSNGGQVSVRSQGGHEAFELGRRNFVNASQRLMAFGHPALVQVDRVWETNGTAYRAMPYYQDPTLGQWLREHGSPSEPWLLALVAPLIDALEAMHRDRCYHCGISPDNILLLQPLGTEAGGWPAVRPLLLGFGAGRPLVSDATRWDESPAATPGAWTDVHALCAVLHAAVSGRGSAPSAGAGRCSAPFLAIIDAGMSVQPEQRPQDMAALRALIRSMTSPAAHRADDRHGKRGAPVPMMDMPEPAAQPVPPPARRLDRTQAMPPAPRPSKRARQGPSRKTPLVAGGVLAVLLIVGGGWWAFAPKPPMTGPVPASMVVASPAPPAEPFTALAGLQDIVRHADPRLRVTVRADKTRLRIDNDRLQFRVKSREPGYLYVFMSGTRQSSLHLLFPNEIDRNNRIEANTDVVLPREPWAITAGGPPGRNHILTMVSRSPRDFRALGLHAAGDKMLAFDMDKAERLWAAHIGRESPFVGAAVCAVGAACDAGYGASLLEVEEVLQDQ